MMDTDYDFFRKCNGDTPCSPPPRYIHEFVENRRVLPNGTPIPGPWRNDRTPFWVEIMIEMSPYSPTQQIEVMKGAQLGATTLTENVALYYIGGCPAEIMFISATEELLEKWATKRLEPAIDSCGLRHLIFAQTENRLSKRLGDKVFSKEFVGGGIDMVSAQSAAGLRSASKRVLLRDEVDGAPPQLRTGEGNWMDVSKARTNSWGARRKILDNSTPALESTSEIYQGFLSGDQRRYFVPCPLCGKEQPLEFGLDKKSNSGLKADTEAGQLVDAYYLCDFCHDAIHNNHKGVMLRAGHWEPMSKSSESNLRSYQLSSLYSPVGMLSWRSMYQEYLNAQAKPEGMRSFTNLYLGLPYKEDGSRPKINEVIELRSGYASGSVPDGVVFITVGMDVQRGSADAKKDNPARIEMEILGHGVGYRTWSIDYRCFYGPIDVQGAGAWQELQEWAEAGGFQLKRLDGKGTMSPVLILIDSGDGPFADVVYNFCDGWPGTYPSKGSQVLKKRKHERPDERLEEVDQFTFKRYRKATLPGDRILVEISTVHYKWHVYNNLKIKPSENNLDPVGLCKFPSDYRDDYFEMLTAEERRNDGSFFCPSGRRNEALDCRVSALCAGDMFLDERVQTAKAAGKMSGMTEDQVRKITHRVILDLLARNVRK